jgi:hypothetical protein
LPFFDLPLIHYYCYFFFFFFYATHIVTSQLADTASCRQLRFTLFTPSIFATRRHCLAGWLPPLAGNSLISL